MKGNVKKWTQLMILAMAGGIIYRLPYLRELYYIPLKEAANITNSQLGMLLSAFGVGNFLLYFPGGWAADRFSARKLIAFSLVSTGLIGLYYASFPSFIMLLLIHLILAVTTVFTFWATAIRCVRLLGESHEQGKLFGIWTFGRGLSVTVAGFVSLQIFSKFGQGTSGMRATIIFYSLLTIILGIAAYFAFDDEQVSDEAENEKITPKEMVAVLKYPALWLVGALVFASWSVFIGFTMFTPFLTDIVNMKPSDAATTILYASVVFILGGLASGFIADKIGSKIKLMFFCFIGMTAVISAYLFAPLGPDSKNSIILGLFVLGLFVYGNQAVFFAIIDEIKIPQKATGIAAGMISFIGYLPEIFCYALVGKLVDRNPGIVGYQHVFIYMIACAVGGMVCAIVLLVKYVPHLEGQTEAAQEELQEITTKE